LDYKFISIGYAALMSAAVEPERDAVSCGKAANRQRRNCYLLPPDLHMLITVFRTFPK
jgi:hypothetical protein